MCDMCNQISTKFAFGYHEDQGRIGFLVRIYTHGPMVTSVSPDGILGDKAPLRKSPRGFHWSDRDRETERQREIEISAT